MTEEITNTDEMNTNSSQPVENTGPKLRWYVVQAFSGYEGRVQKTLLEHIQIHGLEDKFGQILVPTEEVVEMRAGQKRKSARKFFPGYVLVQMAMDEEAWHLVKSVPRVLGFIGGTSDRPAPITQKKLIVYYSVLKTQQISRNLKRYLKWAKLSVLLTDHLLTLMVWLKNLIMRKTESKFLCLFLVVRHQLI